MTWMLLAAVFGWAEASDGYRSNPRTPEETLKSIELFPGLEIEVAAAEPLIASPVAITFDDKGRLFVVEYRDYPNGPEKGQPPLSRVKLLHDDNSDGRYDRATIFADNLSFAQGLMAYKDGLLVTAAPDVLYLKDTNGDGKADVREVLFTGFKVGNPQLRTAHPRWGMDNWIYMTNGLSGGTVSSAKDKSKTINIEQHDFRFDPRTGAFEPATGKGQFGNTFDDWGNRFFCSNRNPIVHAILPYRALMRNPYAVITETYQDVAKVGGDAKVYPIAETYTTAYEHSGTHTAACGVHVYRGDLLGPDFSNNVFVCEPTGYLVTRSKLIPHGVTFRAERDRPKKEFLAAKDQWFRPVSLADGPDGALYVIDMYREVIEHPAYMPKGLPEKLRLRAGADHGRIYRIKPNGAKPRPYTPPKTNQDLVNLLGDPNGWRRMVGQRLLVATRNTRHRIHEIDLRKVLSAEKNSTTQIHALWALEGMDLLEAVDIERSLDDPNPIVQENGVELSARFLKESPQLLHHLSELAKSSSPRVRFRVAIALGETNAPEAAQLLASIAQTDAADPWICRAVLSSCRDLAGRVLGLLAENSEFASIGTPDRIELVANLAGIVGARGNEQELAELLKLVVNGPQPASWWQAATIVGVAQGILRQKGGAQRTSLAALIERPPATLASQTNKVRQILEQTARLAADRKRSNSDRLAAIRLVGYGPVTAAIEVFPALIAPNESSAIQLACVEAMRTTGSEAVAPILLASWPGLRPEVRNTALELLFARPATRLATLQAMSEGKVDRVVVSLDQRTRLLADGDAKIKALATNLFGGQVSANRAAVVNQYKSAVTLKASAAEGHKAYKKVCFNCHKINGEGHEVGPDISDVRNKTKETLLYDIMDPNRAVEPRWLEYIVAANDGRVLTGLFVREAGDAVVLRKAEGKEEIIPRAQIESMRASGKSLMPEGVEKDLSVQQFADLLEFLKQQK